MKIRHNKKRNTAFLYEALLVELTKAIVSQDANRKNQLIEAMAIYFSEGTSLKKDLECYKALNETSELDTYTAEKLIWEVKRDRAEKIDSKRLFTEQTSLIKLINKNISKSVFSNFVPGYKSLATIAQVFNTDLTAKNRVLLEKELVKQLISSSETPSEKEMVQIDNLTYNTFVKKFNEIYSTSLLEEQRDLLNKYILSFTDNETALKTYLNEELGRLKQSLDAALNSENCFKDDSTMKSSAKKVLNMINEFKIRKIDQEMIEKVLKIQTLVKEIEADG
mgnify:CR=1 FL=1